MVIVALLDVLSIGAVLPFLAILVNPERVFLSPYFSPVRDVLGIDTPHGLVQPLLFLFAISILLASIARIILLIKQAKIGQEIGLDLGVSIYERSLHQPYETQTSRNTSDIISGIWKSDTVVGSLILPIFSIVSAGILVLLMAPAMFAIGGEIFGALCLFVLAAYLMIMRLSKKSVDKYSQKINSSQNRTLKVLQEGLAGIRDIILDGSQEIFVGEYRNSDKERRDSIAAIHIISVIPKYFLECFGILVIVLLAYAISGSGNITDSIPILGAIALGVQRLLPPVQQAFTGWAVIRGGHSSLLHVLELLNQPLPLKKSDGSVINMTFDESIRLQNVSYRFPSAEKPILDNVNVIIPKGSRVGIVGGTGSGKSTLVDLIMGLLQPSHGSMLIDNKKITSVNVSAWMSHIAHVPQTIFLSDASISENIAFGIPKLEIDYGRVQEAAALAHINKDIEDLPSQYETQVGERGVRLSGGQRQRIGIARALYKKADVLILDEATSALDSETERSVMQTLNALRSDMTVISVAHRITTLKNCDFIVELKSGSNSHKLTYDDLIKSTE